MWPDQDGKKKIPAGFRSRYHVGLVPQLVILVVCVAVIVGVVVGMLLISTGSNVLRRDKLEDNLHQAELGAQFASNYMMAVEASVQSFAVRPTVVQAMLAGTPEQLQTEVSLFDQVLPAVTGMAVVDDKAIQRVFSVVGASTLGQSFADRDYFQHTLATGKPFLGEPVTSRATGLIVVVYAVPVLDDSGQFLGMVSAGISLKALSDAIVNVAYADDARASIVDVRQGGIIVAHTDPQRVMTPVSGKNEAASRLLLGESGAIETTSSTGEVDLIGFAAVPDLPWGIMVITPSETALAPVTNLRNQAALIVLICVIVVGMLGAWWMFRAMRPLAQLRDAAREFARGDLSYRVRLTPNNEIGQVAVEFNRMASALFEKEGQLLERTRELEASNREMEAFSYSVSHDLRAPLRGIDGFSKVLLQKYQDKLDENGKNYLNRVRAAAQRMGSLIDDMLILSRITRSEMKQQKVDLTAVARTIAVDLQRAEPERKTEFVIAEGLIVNGDPALLEVVLQNLLGNAWKFTGKHSCATIEFGVTRLDGETAYFVRDDGAGFDMTYAAKLFAPFQRLHSMEEFPGNGIGLATVQRIIHRFGGEVWGKGEVEKGATFYFKLNEDTSRVRETEPS